MMAKKAPLCGRKAHLGDKLSTSAVTIQKTSSNMSEWEGNEQRERGTVYRNFLRKKGKSRATASNGWIVGREKQRNSQSELHR